MKTAQCDKSARFERAEIPILHRWACFGQNIASLLARKMQMASAWSGRGQLKFIVHEHKANCLVLIFFSISRTNE
jgi:hypothetical protein